MKYQLIPGGSDGEITCNSPTAVNVLSNVLLDQGYVVMISREEDLYILNYIWSERGADRNDVVFMDRCDLEEHFYEVDEEEEEEEDDYYKRQRIERDAANSAWHVTRQLIHKSPEQIEEIFGVKEMDREKFWNSYPDQIMYDDARGKLYDWERKRMAKVEDDVMHSAIDWWDRMSEEQVREKMDD